MIFGMSIYTFTLVHTVISLIGIATGLVVLYRLLMGQGLDIWNTIFLVTTALTSVTGFGFPFTQLLPSHIFGIISLIVLAIAIAALYAFHLRGVWAFVYVGCAMFALYLNSFVGVVQAFLKIPAVKALAPTQGEPPFLIAQAILLIAFVVLGVLAARKFHPRPAM
ncbi:MAG TPA: hypothetical protein VJL90_05275 [Pseudorhodoplanes sp.]|nr:hypothetical protein [Pseudorhodoplanes sp.]